MIRRWWRRVTLQPTHRVPCWCGSLHDLGYWHDPTAGRIDQDIQEHARELLDMPKDATHGWLAGQRRLQESTRLVQVEEALQSKRDAGFRLWWERDEALRDERTNR